MTSSTTSTSSTSRQGNLKVAAALVFHLPGSRLELYGHNGTRCTVGPLTDPRCVLHPAEFRDLIVSCDGMLESFKTPQGDTLGPAPRMTLTTSMPGVSHVGNGLYRIEGNEATSYCFATLLPARVVDSVLSGLESEIPVDYDSNKPESESNLDEVIAVNLIQDEGLAVTTVVMGSDDISDAVTAQIALSADSACLVAEIQQGIESAARNFAKTSGSNTDQ